VKTANAPRHREGGAPSGSIGIELRYAMSRNCQRHYACILFTHWHPANRTAGCGETTATSQGSSKTSALDIGYRPQRTRMRQDWGAGVVMQYQGAAYLEHQLL